MSVDEVTCPEAECMDEVGLTLRMRRDCDWHGQGGGLYLGCVIGMERRKDNLQL
jgi:hypothetical protein